MTLIFTGKEILVKPSYASIPDIQTSKWVKELTDNNVDAIVQCKYNSLFKKWTPVKEVNSKDTLLDVKELFYFFPFDLFFLFLVLFLDFFFFEDFFFEDF